MGGLLHAALEACRVTIPCGSCNASKGQSAVRTGKLYSVTQVRGITEYHRSCADNLHEALQELGLSTPETPGPFNLWMNVPWDSHGNLENKVPASKPGDYIILRAEMDAIIVFSCCPNVRPLSALPCWQTC